MSGKVKYKNLSTYQKKKYLGEFYTMMSLPKSRDEMKDFVKDLLTLSETVMISRRIQIAKMLLRGESKRKIRDNLGVGFTTINHVERWLKKGFGGYKKTLEKFQKHYKRSKKDQDFIEPFTFKALRKKYPAHFWLLNSILDRDK